MGQQIVSERTKLCPTAQKGTQSAACLLRVGVSAGEMRVKATGAQIFQGKRKAQTFCVREVKALAAKAAVDFDMNAKWRCIKRL